MAVTDNCFFFPMTKICALKTIKNLFDDTWPLTFTPSNSEWRFIEWTQILCTFHCQKKSFWWKICLINLGEFGVSFFTLLLKKSLIKSFIFGVAFCDFWNRYVKLNFKKWNMAFWKIVIGAYLRPGQNTYGVAFCENS